MENSALNAAHAKERRAEALVRERRFEEAAKCHEQAASLFAQILKRFQTEYNDVREQHSITGTHFEPSLTSSHLQSAVESIRLQKDHHQKQAAFVRMKQAQYEEYLATKETAEKEALAKHMMKYCSKGNTRHFVVTDPGDKSLPQAIDKAMEEQDSLLEFILTPQNGNVGVKLPKDPGAVLEELRTVNSQLRALIGSLLGQLEASQMQVKVLTEKLRAAAGSDEISSTLTNEDGTISLSPLPPLAPLEMPSFDFSTT